MVIYHGRYTKGFFKAEAAKNTNPGGTFNWIGVTSRFTKTINPNLVDVRGTGSALRQYSIPSRKEYDVGIEYYVQDLDFISEVLNPTATYDTYTIEIRDSGDGVTYLYWLFTGAILNTLSLRARVGDVVMATVGGHSMDLTVSGSSGIGTDPTDPATAPWAWHNGSVSVGGVDAPEIIEYTLDTTHNSDRRFGFTGTEPRDNILSGFDVSGTLMFTVEGSTYVDDILADTEQDLILYLNSTTHYITVSDAKFGRLEQPSEANVTLTETLNFVGKNATVTAP